MRLGIVRLLALLTAALLAVTLLPASPGTAAPAERRPPGRIALPDGFQPEGIAVHRGRAYFGSLADGSIYTANLRTGEGRRLRKGPGTPAVGLKLDARRGRLYVAGGESGTARVVSARTGRVLRTFRLATAPNSFVNDVVLTSGAAWFTDSANPVLYRVPIRRDGTLPPASRVDRVPLRGAFQQPDDESFGANGIEVPPNGVGLLVVNSTDGRLYRVDRRTGRAQVVRLGGASLTNGDGLLRLGNRLFVVRNQLNRVAVLRLGARGLSGRQVRVIRDRRFDVPTTVGAWGGALYLPNARFTTPPTPRTRYAALRVPR